MWFLASGSLPHSCKVTSAVQALYLCSRQEEGSSTKAKDKLQSWMSLSASKELSQESFSMISTYLSLVKIRSLAIPNCRRDCEINFFFFFNASHVATLRIDTKTKTSNSSSKKYFGVRSFTLIPASCPQRMVGLLRCRAFAEWEHKFGPRAELLRPKKRLSCVLGSPSPSYPHTACSFTAKSKLNKYFKVLFFPPMMRLLVNVLRKSGQTS